MKKWPLNSTILFAVSHSKLRRVADGTGTSVATCMINKWTPKINEKEIYNEKCPSKGREAERKRKKEGRRLQFLPPLKAFAAKHQRTKEKKNQTSDQARGYTFTLPLDDSIISSPYDHVRLLELSLKPSSWAHFLYHIYCIGPVGFGLIYANNKEPPNSGPYNNHVNFFSENDSLNKVFFYIFFFMEYATIKFVAKFYPNNIIYIYI